MNATLANRLLSTLLTTLAVLASRSSAQPTAPPAPTQEKPVLASQQDEPHKLGSDWVRLKRDDADRPLAMQTAIVRYQGAVNGQPVLVDLVSAVHVGDKAYYAALNREFQQYDALLYELVAPEGAVVQPGRTSSSPIGAVQNGMSSMLELEHQLEHVDYTRPNFVHADMTPDQFFKTMEDRDESVMKIFFEMLGQGIAMQTEEAHRGESTDMEMLMALFSNDRPRKLKIAMAKQMDRMESMLTGFGGADGSTIITERNKAALAVLKRELSAGKRKLGVFYGAGHLEDMHKRLVNDFGLKPVSIRWLDAWNLQ